MERDRLQNWLDYNQLKFERHPEKKPTKKVQHGYVHELYKHDEFMSMVLEEVD